MSLKNRIDFAGIISARMCNPNGDPTNGNAPRTDWDGYGIISDVCLKRKIRDRLQEAGYEILMQLQGKQTDGLYSTYDRVKAESSLMEAQKQDDPDLFTKLAEKWIDVRSFGQVFAFKGDKKSASGVSVGVRGPVSIQFARSLDIILEQYMQITKSLSLETDPKNPHGRDSTTMSIKHYIERGVYTFFGSIYPKMAEKTDFSEEDAEAIKDAIVHMFVNDASHARPAGSMTMEKVYWWKHNCPSGQYSPAAVYKTLNVTPLDNYPYYKVELSNLPNLEPEIIDGW